jgi:flavin reductase (DIM6/NTAB) family NADH-FMN oxidoreductase RutF
LAVSAGSFRRALGQFATGVTVVTTVGPGGEPLGLTVNAFSAVSLDPPLVLVCIDNRSEAHEGFDASRVFGVSVLREDQEAFSRRFATPGREKFAVRDLHLGESGVALVPHALAHIECRVVASHASGDHTIYVGEVVRLEVGAGRPLIYHASGYARLGGGPR